MYSIISIKTASTPTCAYEWAYNAEAAVYASCGDEKNAKIGYVHVCWAMCSTFYSFSEESEFDFMTGATDREPSADHIEEFTSLEQAQESEFIDLYRMLDQIIYAMHFGPKQAITDQAILKAQRAESDVSDEREGECHFAVIRSYEYECENYEASISIITGNSISFEIKKEGVLIEHYDDLETAAYSRWFLIYCLLKKELTTFVKNYRQKHPDQNEMCSYIISGLE